MLRVEISEDEYFDPRNPECHPDIIRDYDEGRITAYNVDLVQIHRCSFEGCKDYHSEMIDCIGGTLLDGPGWAGTYGMVEVDAWPPGPDANHIRELVNQMMAAQAA